MIKKKFPWCHGDGVPYMEILMVLCIRVNCKLIGCEQKCGQMAVFKEICTFVTATKWSCNPKHCHKMALETQF